MDYFIIKDRRDAMTQTSENTQKRHEQLYYETKMNYIT